MIIKRHGEITINGCCVEVELAIEGDYQPREKATLEYPGSDSRFKISGIWLGGSDISGAFGKPDIEKMEEKILIDVIERKEP